MRTDAWCMGCAGLVAAQALMVGALPMGAASPFTTIFLSLAVAAATLLAWIAIDGRRPTTVVLAGMLLAFMAAHSQAEFVVAALAAAATGGILLFKTKGRVCAESSQP